ncbi:disintegrin and metalloproteinase domain-containing protein [Plakobranchus ocellatus]|uniref:Disintegrin and metalloproteinase domain-containing protein n=1 Tax=Plakobranchus ocellatus TaxID=259542 RepID=A0AAV3Z2Q3_9GAST|nr:disintegrin and metalloproteinase domain-containing protein [Plakobranchus ocellatus]
MLKSVMDSAKILALLGCITLVAADLSDRLRYFETLHHVNIKVRKRRSTDAFSNLEKKDVSFSALGRKKMCGGVHPEDEPDYDPHLEQLAREEEEAAARNSTRRKRAAGDNTCHIIAVADTTYLNGPGGGFPHRATNAVIQSLQSVNNIYRNVMWNSDLKLTGLGFQIKVLRIHQDYTKPKDYHSNNLHYNMERSYWPDIELLRQFGRDKEFHKYCLAHLFTHRSFNGGVLGLAYIASSRRGTLGGICSDRRSGGKTLNTGFSSTMNTKGNNLLTQEAVLVTTHGHNWGAEHDAETSECAPSSFNKGKYVMYPYAVSGYEENNKKFSPCSKRYITEVLTAKSDKCFKDLQAFNRVLWAEYVFSQALSPTNTVPFMIWWQNSTENRVECLFWFPRPLSPKYQKSMLELDNGS